MAGILIAGAGLAALFGQLWLSALALVLAAARAAGWSAGRLALLAAAAWAAVTALIATAPESPVARFVGWSAEGLAVAGAAIALVALAAAVLARLHRRAALRFAAAPGVIAPRHAASPTAQTAPQPSLLAAAPAGLPGRAPAMGAPFDPTAPLSDPELDRYARHIVLRELGGAGQRRLRAARVLIVGAGGLGAPVAFYLAAAGFGRITLADDDRVSLSNLQRQILFETADQGRLKAEVAAERLCRLNPHIVVTPLARRITADDAALIAGHDLVIDGTDSFAARQAVNAACVKAGVPLLAGSVAQWEGQVTIYDPAQGAPCMACLFPTAPAPGRALGCAEAGVIGALPGVIGTTMALEAIKELAGIAARGDGAGLRGSLLMIDGLWGETRRVSVTRDPGCPVCGSAASA